jgi:hypothetical protein
MAAGERVLDVQPKFDGGLNNVSDDSNVQPNQVRTAVNARLTDYGAISKRGGTRRTDSSPLAAQPILGGYTWTRDNGTTPTLAVCNSTLYTSTYAPTAWTWTAQSGNLSSTVSSFFTTFRDGTGNDVVYIADGGPLNKWNGTALTTNIASTPNTSMIAVYNQRLWGCGNSSYPESIFYSSLNNGDTLGIGASGGGQIVVRTFGQETIVGLATINTSLLIFHQRGISRLTGYGQDDLTVAPQSVTADVGTIAKNSIVASNNIAYFISERGLYRCNESEVSPVGVPEQPDPILPIIRQLSSADFDKIHCQINRATKELWIIIPGFGCYQYHTVLNAWSGPWDTGFTTPDACYLFEALDLAGLPIMMMGDSGGYVNVCDVPGLYLDRVNPDGTGGTTYAMSVQLHRLYSGDDAMAKSLRWGYLTAQLKGSGQTRIEWTTGTDSGSYELPGSFNSTWGDAATQWGLGTWGGAGSTSYRIPMGGTGYYTDITIVDSGGSIPVFSRFQLEAFALGRR